MWHLTCVKLSFLKNFLEVSAKFLIFLHECLKAAARFLDLAKYSDFFFRGCCILLMEFMSFLSWSEKFCCNIGRGGVLKAASSG